MTPIRWASLALLLMPAALHAGASNSLMDVHPSGKKLLVTNADNGTVSVIDLKERKVIHEIPVGDKPEGACWVGDSDRWTPGGLPEYRWHGDGVRGDGRDARHSLSSAAGFCSL